MSLFQPDENEAEYALIGCVFAGALFEQGNRAFAEISSELSLEVFQNISCRSAFEIFAEFVEAGVTIELPAVAVEWKKRFRNRMPNEIMFSGDLVPSWHNWRYYREFIAEHFHRRQATEALTDVATQAKDPHKTLYDLAERLNEALVDCSPNSELVDAAQFADEFHDKVDDLRKLDGNLPGLSTGFRQLDRKTNGLKPGEISILAARPSEGKSAFGVAVIMHIAFTLRESVLFVSLEMPRASIALRMAASRCNVDYGAIQTGDFDSEELLKLSKFEAEVKGSNLFIMDASELTISELKTRCHRLVKSKGIRLIVVDYLQKVRGASKKDYRREEIAEVSEGLKAIAKRDSIHVMALAQVNREGAKDERAPKIHEIADSDQIQRDADLCLILHRQRIKGSKVPTDTTTLYIAKAREGQLDSIDFRFDGRHQRFSELSPIADEDIPEQGEMNL